MPVVVPFNLVSFHLSSNDLKQSYCIGLQKQLHYYCYLMVVRITIIHNEGSINLKPLTASLLTFSIPCAQVVCKFPQHDIVPRDLTSLAECQTNLSKSSEKSVFLFCDPLQ